MFSPDLGRCCYFCLLFVCLFYAILFICRDGSQTTYARPDLCLRVITSDLVSSSSFSPIVSPQLCPSYSLPRKQFSVPLTTLSLSVFLYVIPTSVTHPEKPSIKHSAQHLVHSPQMAASINY